LELPADVRIEAQPKLHPLYLLDLAPALYLYLRPAVYLCFGPYPYPPYMFALALAQLVAADSLPRVQIDWVRVG